MNKDEETIQKAMQILIDGLDSSNEEIRLKAAIEISRYTK